MIPTVLFDLDCTLVETEELKAIMDDVERGKPDLEIDLLVAEKIGVPRRSSSWSKTPLPGLEPVWRSWLYRRGSPEKDCVPPAPWILNGWSKTRERYPKWRAAV